MQCLHGAEGNGLNEEEHVTFFASEVTVMFDEEEVSERECVNSISGRTSCFAFPVVRAFIMEGPGTATTSKQRLYRRLKRLTSIADIVTMIRCVYSCSNEHVK